jgi:hypothetical protein
MAGEGQGEERSVYHGEGDRQGGENLSDGDELKTALAAIENGVKKVIHASTGTA